MTPITRREALLTLSTAGSALLLGKATAASNEEVAPRAQMGIVTYAFGIHQKNRWGGLYQGLPPALALLEESHRLGAAGIQADLAGVDATHASELRRWAEKYHMYIEATVITPRAADDVVRFEKDVQTAKAAGATLGRTTILPGRRYEEFKSMAAFRQAEQHGLQSLQWAEPVLARHQFHLAVENHKDQRIGEKLETIKRVNSEFVGICVDIGNSFTLMEDPVETVRAFAPFALTVHFKDQALRESEDGFWFADVALGEGFIDLLAIVKILREAKPKIRFNLEVITRDPLSVPVLTTGFWTTMPDTPASELARVLRMVKTKGSPKPFENVSQKAVDQQLAFELRNVERSFAYAREQLSLL
jgi:sugar phosphate isomerase/epimerase